MKIRGQIVYPLKERLERLSKPVPSGCIEWQSATRNGYGRLIIGSRTDGTRESVSAHRLSYEVYVGKIPAGLFVCHKCDNPKCINPDHLFVGTRKDNTDDREAKNRNKIHLIRKKGADHPFAKFSDRVISKIRLSTKSTKETAMKYGVSERYVRDIRNNKYRPAPPKKGDGKVFPTVLEFYDGLPETWDEAAKLGTVTKNEFEKIAAKCFDSILKAQKEKK